MLCAGYHEGAVLRKGWNLVEAVDNPPMIAPDRIAAVVADAMVAKAKKPKGTMFLLAISAGALIGLGFVYYVTTQMGASSVEWTGLTKVAGGLAFSVGLGLVILTGADLFTSTTVSVIPAVRRTISPGTWASHWAVVYLGNLVGAVGLATLVFYAGVDSHGGGAFGSVVLEVASAKVSHSWLEAFLLGVLANFLVCLAVWVSFAARTVAGKIIAITGPISLFVATGFEHSVANMFMIPLGIMVGSRADAATVSDLGINVDQLTVTGFITDNLIPVTAGNIVGGTVLVALFYWLVYLKKQEG